MLGQSYKIMNIPVVSVFKKRLYYFFLEIYFHKNKTMQVEVLPILSNVCCSKAVKESYLVSHSSSRGIVRTMSLFFSVQDIRINDSTCKLHISIEKVGK